MSIVFDSTALECVDARELAAFYATITGGTYERADDEWVTLRVPGGVLCFQTAPGYRAPTWPDPASSMQMHMDFNVDDLDESEAVVLAAGATKFDFQPGDHFRVYADPAGHPFCLCVDPATLSPTARPGPARRCDSGLSLG